MIEGVLTINLDPPYLQFQGGDTSIDGCLRECTTEEVRAALHELGQVCTRAWPLHECVIRLRGKFPIVKLSMFGLLRERLAGVPEQLHFRIAN